MENVSTFSFKVSKNLLTKVDELVELVNEREKEKRCKKISRADLLRSLIEMALEEIEKDGEKLEGLGR